MATPLWFYEKVDKIYYISAQKRYKLKWIQNNPNVKIAPCSFQGKVKVPHIEGTAQVVSENECSTIINLFKKKYLIAKLMMRKRKKGEKKPVCVEVTLKKL